MGQGDIRVLREQIDGSFAEHVLHASDLGLVPYELKNANFTAATGKNYAVDAHPVPAVYPTFTHGGLVFTAKVFPSTVTIYWSNDGSLYQDSATQFYIAGNETLADMLNFINDGDFAFTVALDEGASLTDAFPDDGAQEYTFSGGSAAGLSSVEATLPVNPAPGTVIGFADARGLWGTYPFTVKRSSGPLPAVVGASHKLIEGGTANFTNNAAGTFFSMVFIDNAIGWRVLLIGTKPLNLTAPTVAGTYNFAATPGTWTGSPTSFAYQWQMSDDGETGWADIEGATGATYLAVEADTGKFVRVGVIATNSNGPSAVVYSAASSAIDVPDFPMTGLLAFWKLDDLTDASGNGNTLTNNNGVTFGAGKIGNAAEFDGSNDLTGTGGALAGDFTLSTWFYTADLANTASFGVIVALGSRSAGLQLYYTNAGGVFAYQEGTGGGYKAQSATGAINNATWHNIIMTRIDGDLTIWINGASIATGTTAVTLSDNVFIGTHLSGNVDMAIGLVDAVGIWNRALTSEEIAQLYNGGDGVEP